MADGYKPTSGMQSAARRAIKLKEQGKAKGAGTAVGWTRAGQLARGETLSLSTVKRMYSFFSRHEVDKKGKDWDNAENPSNGKIMWLAWGGDAGYSWSRKIVNREKNMKKMTEVQEFVDEIKGILEDSLNPIDNVIEISDDESIAKGKEKDETKEEESKEKEMHKQYEDCGCKTCKSKDIACEDCPDCKDTMDKAACDCKTCKEKGIPCKDCPDCMSKSYESDNEDEDKWDNMQKACWSGYTQRGMKEKNGRMVPNCVPVKKSIFGTEGPQTLIPKNKP